MTPAQRGLTKKNQPTQDPSRGCPQAAPDSYHRVTLVFGRSLPEKLGLRLNTDAEIRWSECADLAQTTGPLARLERVSGSELIVHVDHRGFYGSLPRETGFELYDLRGCGPGMVSFYKAAVPVPLSWKLEFPNGATCAGRAVGEYRGAVTESFADLDPAWNQ